MHRSIALLSVALLVSPLIAWSAEPILSYERVHRQVAHEDNAVKLTVFENGRVEAHLPFYSPNAGSHEWHIASSELQRLLEIASPLRNMRTEQLTRDIQVQRTQRMTEVADADQVTIELHEASRNPRRITAPSPDIWARNLPADHAMNDFASIAEDLNQWMRENAQERQP